jgi:hypothetical protein
MWPWTKRWRDWAMHDLWSLRRTGPQPQALHFCYEKAGLTILDEAIPWNAELVMVEAVLRLPSAVARRKSDFQVKIPGQAAISADTLRRVEGDERYRLSFRLAPPGRSVIADLSWRHRRLAQLSLPFLSRDAFVQNISVQMPTSFVRLGEQSVACQTFVSTQCRGLLVSALLSSPTSLVPLTDLGFHVKFRSERTGIVHSMPAQLSPSQLASRQALVAVVPRRLPRRVGSWAGTWVLGNRSLATERLRAVSQKQFLRSLRVTDSRFIVQPLKGEAYLARQLPPLGELRRAGPCFLVSSLEAGMAGQVRFHIHVQVNGAVEPPLFFEHEAVVTDGPTVVAPGTLDIADLCRVAAFDLRVKGTSIGLLSTSPIPEANFTTEGGFKPAADFSWTAAADEELSERLNRLIDDREPKK